MFRMFCARISFGVLLVLLSACAAQPMYEGMSAPVRSLASSEIPDRQIIRTATMSIEVDEPKATAERVLSFVKARAGHIENTTESLQGIINLKIRIPSNTLDELLDQISTQGSVSEQSTNSRDVTEEMMDVEAELKNLLELRARLRLLLQKAEKVSELLEIERELARVQTQIDRIEGRRKFLSSQVAFSSLELTIKRKKIYGPLGYLGMGLIEIISKLFVIRE